MSGRSFFLLFQHGARAEPRNRYENVFQSAEGRSPQVALPSEVCISSHASVMPHIYYLSHRPPSH